MILPPPPPRTETVVQVLSVLPQPFGATASFDHELSLAHSYIDQLAGTAVSAAVHDAGAKFLTAIRTEDRSLAIPTIAPGPDGLLGLTWESSDRHVNVQFFDDGHVEYFAENLHTGELWSQEHLSPVVTRELLTRLRNG